MTIYTTTSTTKEGRWTILDGAPTIELLRQILIACEEADVPRNTPIAIHIGKSPAGPVAQAFVLVARDVVTNAPTPAEDPTP